MADQKTPDLCMHRHILPVGVALPISGQSEKVGSTPVGPHPEGRHSCPNGIGRIWEYALVDEELSHVLQQHRL